MTSDKNAWRHTVIDGYGAKQAERDADYRASYEAWVAGMSAAERVRMRDMGLASPELDRTARGCELDADRCEDQAGQAADVDMPEDPAREEALRLLRMCLSEVVYPRPGQTVAYRVAVVAIVIGMPGLGSVSAVATQHGVTRQAVSKAARRLAKELGVGPSCYMRSEANAEVHRQANRRRAKS